MIEFCFYAFSALLLVAAVGVIFFRNPVHSVLSLIFCFFNAAGLMLLTGAEFVAILLLIVYVGAVAVLFLFVMMMMNVTPQEQGVVFSVGRSIAAARSAGQLIIYSVCFIVAFLGFSLIAPVIEMLGSAENQMAQGYFELLQTANWFIWSPATPLHKVLLVVGPSFLLARQLTVLVTQFKFIDLLSDVLDSIFFVFLFGLSLAGSFLYFALDFKSALFSSDLLESQTPPEDLLSNTEALGQIIYGPYALLFQGCGLILLVAMIGAIVLTFRRRDGIKRQDITSQVMRDPKTTVTLKDVPIGKGLADHGL